MASLKTLLLTGFEPFGKWPVNPSWEIARRLDDEQTGGLRVVGRRLPVNWSGSWPALLDLIEEVKPDAILMLGLANSRPYISVEAQGSNTCNETPDNEGKMAASRLLLENGDEALPSTLPVDDIVRRIQQLNLPVQVSTDAGAYLCNLVTYNSLNWAHENRKEMPLGFIHLPNITGPDISVSVEDAGGMTLEEMGSAVAAAIEAISYVLATEPEATV